MQRPHHQHYGSSRGRFPLSREGWLRRFAALSVLGAQAGLAGVPTPAWGARIGTAQWFYETQVRSAPAAPGASSPGLTPPVTGVTSPEVALQHADRSLHDLNMAVQAIAAARTAQRAAQALAISLDTIVPDGHASGGLMEAEGAVPNLGSQDCITGNQCLWINASLPQETVEAGRKIVTVEQDANKAVLTWQSFNIGRHTTLRVDQHRGTQSDGNNDWIALNRVSPGAEPSQILGRIEAEGSVYIINQNGIMFDSSSSVDVHSLLASTLPLYLPAGSQSLTQLSPQALQRSNQLFLTSGLVSVGPGSAGGSVLGLAEGESINAATAEAVNALLPGDLTIEEGAKISVRNNGFLLAAAPNVYQRGWIDAVDSEVAVAAGIGVQLRSNEADGRFDVAVSGRINDASDGGVNITPVFEIENSGLVQSQRGSAVLAASNIRQGGVISATTSVSRLGSIDLRASDSPGGRTRTGAVTLGEGSTITILPDSATETTNSSAAATALFKPLGVTLTGAAITLEPGALVEAPGHNLTMTAIAQDDGAVSASALQNGEIPGRVYISPDAIADVAGLANVEVPLASVLITVPRLGLNELADSPLQRNGLLFASSVTVDSRIAGVRDDGAKWVGTPLANLAGYVDQIPRGVRELLRDGGSISLYGNEVLAQEGATLNLSGGYVHYLGGMLDQTRLLTASGSVVDISAADPLVRYVGFAGQALDPHPRWNITNRYLNPLLSSALTDVFEADDVSGGNAGRLLVYAQSTALIGATIDAHAVSGRRQIADGKPASGGTATFGGNFSNRIFPSAVITAGPSFRIVESLPEALFDEITDATTALADRGEDASDRTDVRWWTPVSASMLHQAGFGSLQVVADSPGALNMGGEIVVEEGAQLDLGPGGRISLSASRIEVNGNLRANAGSIELRSTGRSFLEGSTAGQSAADADSEFLPGDILIAPGSRIDVSGLFVNDGGLGPDRITGSAFVNGGRISLETRQSSAHSRLGEDVIDLTGSIVQGGGSVLDVSSGARVLPNGQLARSNGVVAGNGGQLFLQTYVFSDAPFGRSDTLELPTVMPSEAGRLVLEGALEGFGFSSGGTLTLRAPGLQIGGNAPADQPWVLSLDPTFFAANGFGRFELNAEYDATISQATVLDLRQRNLLPNFDADGHPVLLGLATGANLFELRDGASAALVRAGLLDDFHRKPVSLALYSGDYLTWNQRVRDPDTGDLIREGAPDLSEFGITGTLLIGEGARVAGDAGAQLTFGSHHQVTLLGEVLAHGGRVTLTADTARGGYAQNPGFVIDGSAYADTGKSVFLGEHSVINVSGTVLLDTLSTPAGGRAFPAGRVLDGGDVVITADTGYIIALNCNDVDDCTTSTAKAADSAVTSAASPAVVDAALLIPKFGDNGGGNGGAGGGATGDATEHFPGAAIVVSGTSGTVSVLDPDTRLPQPTTLVSNAGHITLGAGAGLYFDGVFLARSGGGRAAGGTLTITPEIGVLQNTMQPDNGFAGATRLVLSNGRVDLPEGGKTPGSSVTGAGAPTGILNFAASSLDGSGIASLFLGTDPVLGAGSSPVPISITTSLDLRLGRELSINTFSLTAAPQPPPAHPSATPKPIKIELSAPYVALHGYQPGAIYSQTEGRGFVPAPGLSTLDISANTLDLGGHLALDGFKTVSLTGRDEIRFITPPRYSQIAGEDGNYQRVPGVLQVSAGLEMSAPRIYPATDNAATIIADNSFDEEVVIKPHVDEDEDGEPDTMTVHHGSTASVTFRGFDGANGTNTAPLSVGGRLIVSAVEIEQRGNLYAPGGEIILGVASSPDDLNGLLLLQFPLGGSDVGNLFPLATKTVSFGANSLTSVSLEGLDIPFGRTRDGQNLFFNGSGNRDATVADLQRSADKRIQAVGENVLLDSRAVVDLRGGGDLIGSEWIAGTGGSRDVLARQNLGFSSGTPTLVPLYADNRPIYSILPGYRGIAAFDPEFETDPLLGRSVYLSGMDGLPEGRYTLLPASYALMPGAFRLVQDTRAGAQDAISSLSNTRLADGSLQIAGYFADSFGGARDARSTTFLVQPGTVWQQYSEYQLSPLNQYFSVLAESEKRVLRAPGDGGTLSLAAISTLTLDAQIRSNAPASRLGAELQLAAPRLQLIDGTPGPAGSYLQIDARRLNAMDASRIVLGATTDVFLGQIESFNVIAGSVDIAAGTTLRAGEVIAVAHGKDAGDGVTVREGATIEATGQATGRDGFSISIGSAPTDFDDNGQPLDAVTGDGAFLQVSVNNANLPSRDYVGGSKDGPAGNPLGDLRINAGARLIAPGSLTFDATGSTSIAASTQLETQELLADAARITLGSADVSSSGPAGLVLGPSLRSELASIGHVSLLSRDEIRFGSGVTLAAAGTLELSAGRIAGSGGDAVLLAPTLVLDNRLDAAPGTETDVSDGRIFVRSQTLQLGDGASGGSLRFDGFARVDIDASAQVLAQGQSRFDFGAADVHIASPAVIAAGAADSVLVTAGTLTASPEGKANSTAPDALGGRLRLDAGAIDWDTALSALSGQIEMLSRDGDLRLRDGAVLSVAGSQRNIFDTSLATSAGSLLLSSANSIFVGSGARLDASAPPGAGDAGSMTFHAVEGEIRVDGNLAGQRSLTGRGAELRLESGGALALDHVAALMAAGGIDGAVDIHTHSGNLELSAGHRLSAQSVSIVADAAPALVRADNGNVRIEGEIDAHGTRGGSVALFGQNGVALGGSIDAHGNAADQRGGKVAVGAGAVGDGSLDADLGYQRTTADRAGAISIGSAALIDVHGGSRGGHHGGDLLLRASLLDNGTLPVSVDAGALITGADRPLIESVARWDAADAGSGARHFDGVIDPAGISDPVLGAFRAAFVTDTLSRYIQNPGAVLSIPATAGGPWRLRAGIDLVNSSHTILGGNIVVASDWNLAAGTFDGEGRRQLSLRTQQGIAPALTLRAAGDLDIRASLSDGFFQTINPFNPAAANAGLQNAVSPMATASNPLPLATASLLGLEPGSARPYDSSSMRLVAGADAASSDPLALDARARAAGSGSVLISSHQSASSAIQPDLQIVTPTMIRTGVGSIDVAAAADLRLLDTSAPGVIYTAGHADVVGAVVPSAAGLQRVPSLEDNSSHAPVLDTGDVQPSAAGDLRISSGRDLQGLTTVSDSTGMRTGVAGTDLSQYWWPWMQRSCLVTLAGCSGGIEASSLNFGMFAQGVMSVGGDVELEAGGSIRDWSVSLPTTWRHEFSAHGSSSIQTVGGGDLVMRAGESLFGGSVFVAGGKATVHVNGRVAAVSSGPGAARPLMLALQDAQLEVAAGRGMNIGGLFNPSYLFKGFDSQTYSADSAVSLITASGNFLLGSSSGVPGAAYDANVGAGTSSGLGGGLAYVLPAQVSAAAPLGRLDVRRAGELYPSASGQLSLLARDDIKLVGPANRLYLGLIDAPAELLPSPANPLGTDSSTPLSFIDDGGAQTNLRLHTPESLHVLDAEPMRIYSERGSIVNGNDARALIGLQEVVSYSGAMRVVSDKPAAIRAGNDIVNLYFVGQNLYETDVTTIAAGRDLKDPQLRPSQQVPRIELGGPGILSLSAGRNIGPLTSANAARDLHYLPLGDPQYPGIRTVGNANNAYLGRDGADISILHGISHGIDLVAFAGTYIDPAVLHDSLNPADALGTPDYSSRLVAFVRQVRRDNALREGGTPAADTAPLSAEQAWREFQLLPAAQRQLLVNDVFLDLLDQVGLDYNGKTRSVVDRAHPDGVEYNRGNIRFLGQYARGYRAVDTLFPARLGYTENALGGSRNGAVQAVRTGELDIRGTTIQTRSGGNISILGPGGPLLVGSASAPAFAPATANTAAIGPNTQGILTLESGAVRIFGDASALLAQSRIFTEQGGNILIWSSNGDINAGKGAKTSSEIPPLRYICDNDLFCLVDARSQVSGAGIAALQSKLDQPAGSVNLIAPVGTVDAGDAGIRVSGSLNVAAAQVANADNIQVQGSAVGVPTGAVNTDAASVGNSYSASAVQAADQVGAGRGPGTEELELFVEILTPADDEAPCEQGGDKAHPCAPAKTPGWGDKASQ